MLSNVNAMTDHILAALNCGFLNFRFFQDIHTVDLIKLNTKTSNLKH